MKLLDRICSKCDLKHFSIRTEKSYVDWAKRYILFYDKKHPDQMGSKEIEAFLTHLVMERKKKRCHYDPPLYPYHFIKSALIKHNYF